MSIKGGLRRSCTKVTKLGGGIQIIWELSKFKLLLLKHELPELYQSKSKRYRTIFQLWPDTDLGSYLRTVIPALYLAQSKLKLKSKLG